MWLFSQVWFACLVGFVVGVGLTWLWQVRPLNRRVGDLERSARLADRPAQQPTRPAEDFRPGFGNTTYDTAAETSVPSGVGVSTPSGRPGLDEMFEPDRPEPVHLDATRGHTVDDYVESLVQEYQGDAPAQTRTWAGSTPEAVESWRPGALGSRLDATDEHDDQSRQQDTSGQFDSQLTSYQPVQHYADPETEPEPAPHAEEATQLQPRPFTNSYGNADEQYLEYLNSGAMDDHAENGTLQHAQPVAEPEPEAVRDYIAQEPEQEYQYPAEQDYPHYPAEQEYAEQQYAAEQVHEEPEHAEVTSVLPIIEDEPAEQEHVHDESPAEQTVVDQEPVREQEDEQEVPAHHDYFQPGEPLTNVVRPHSSGGGLIASAQPFQLGGTDRADAGAQQGQMTPIAEDGWQPFAKPFEEQEYPAEEGAQQWQDDWSGEPEPVNGTHVEAAHQAEPEAPAESTTVFSPVTEDYAEDYSQDYGQEYEEQAPRHQIAESAQPEPEQSYDYAGDYSDYDEEEDSASPSRSLFEPVIEPELQTGYMSPVAAPAAQNGEQGTPQLQPQLQPQGQPQGQGLSQPLGQPQAQRPGAPRPIRVRTGIAQPNRPVRAPSGSAGWQSGPFGPGSALPLPDGSAPAPQFRVKARTSSMVFHTESSPFYERLEPQVWFASQEDAQRAGFTSWERPRTW